MNLYGLVLQSPQLRFNFSSAYAVAFSARQGLKQFGPYDSTIFPKAEIRCSIVYPASLQSIKEAVVSGLTKGEGIFPGFQRMFRPALTFTEELDVKDENESEVIRRLGILAEKDFDIIFLLTSSYNSPLYSASKGLLLACGIPSQILVGEKLEDARQRPWILENVALATYAKVGGTPWVVASPARNNKLVLGISRAQDRFRKYLVGYVTLFTQDGDFVFFHSKAPVPVIRWEDYINGLSAIVTESIQEYEKKKGAPEEIIVHFSKRPGYKELDAIRDAVVNANKKIPFALLHLNEYSNFRLFDTTDRTFVPECGLKVELGRRESLLLLDGRVDGVRRRMGVPRVLDIVLDKRSTLPAENFPGLVEQIYNFARVNWRGFNARSVPVTLNYSRLIARVIAEAGAERWNEIIASVKLKDKSWFL